jgi:hypothetical protein
MESERRICFTRVVDWASHSSGPHISDSSVNNNQVAATRAAALRAGDVVAGSSSPITKLAALIDPTEVEAIASGLNPFLS